MDRELRATAMPGPRDVALRESAPPQHAPPPQHAAPPRPSQDDHRSHVHPRPGHDSQLPRPPSDVWAGAISRLQTQVSYNTSMHESHRRQVHDIEQAVGRLQQEMNNVVTVISELRSEIRSKPGSAEAIKPDPGDLELLATQVAQITTKANEVDGLKLQLELMKNRMRRFEEHGGHTPNPVHTAPPSSHPMHGSPAASSLRPDPSPGNHPHEPTSHPPPPPPQHNPHLPGHALPPMRTASMASPRDDRPPNYPGPPQLNQQASGGYRPPSDHRPHSNEPGPGAMPPGPTNFRPADPLPPPSSLSGWRSADSFTSPAGAHAPLPHQQHAPGRPHGGEADNQSSGWAAVNQPPKRPFEEQRPPYEASPGSGSPKRPKLAPIMPRNHYEEGQHGPPANFAQSAMTPDTFRPRSRAPSDDMQGTPVGGGSQNSFRFVTATAPAPSSAPAEGHHEMWRSETDHAPGRGRGRGRGGRGRGRGSRGGRGGGPTIIQAEPQEPPRPPPEPMPVQMSPKIYYNPVPQQQPQSPRSEVLRRPPGPMEGEHPPGGAPATPIVHAGHDQFAVQDPHSGSGKKSRTKPIRNAEGILIRKDGRPDMRSVSSANNLRKVHAKKEAERADYDGRTPTSSRSLINADSNSEHGGTRSGTPMSGAAGEYHDDDEIEGPNGTSEHEHHEESRLHGQDHGPGPSLADRFFPRQDAPAAHSEDVEMKSESAEERKRSASAKSDEDNKATQGRDRESQGEDSGDNITAVGPPPRGSEKPDVVMQGSDESAKERAEEDGPGDGKAEVNGTDPTTIEVASKPRDADSRMTDEQKAETAVAAA